MEYQTNMFCTLILLPYRKPNHYNRTDNNFGTSSDNSASNTEFPDFSTLKILDKEPRKKSAIKTIHSINANSRTF